MRTMWVGAASVVTMMVGPVAADSGGRSITGDWRRFDGGLRVIIAPCGGQLCVVSTWTRDSESGERVGDRLILSLRELEGSTLAGKAFDERRRLTYSLSISVNRDAMTTPGLPAGRHGLSHDELDAPVMTAIREEPRAGSGTQESAQGPRLLRASCNATAE